MDISLTIPICVLWVVGTPIGFLMLLAMVAGAITLYNLMRL